MTTRERAHALLDRMSEAELDKVVKLLNMRQDRDDGPVEVELPGDWQQLPSGAITPWVATQDEDRRID